jgi:ABC-type branched-subunit amino acid transport system permease subunit
MLLVGAAIFFGWGAFVYFLLAPKFDLGPWFWWFLIMIPTIDLPAALGWRELRRAWEAR